LLGGVATLDKYLVKMPPEPEIVVTSINQMSPQVKDKSEDQSKEDFKVSPRMSKLIEKVDIMKAAIESTTQEKKEIPQAHPFNMSKSKRLLHNNPNLAKPLCQANSKRMKK